jgi:hypothetical protein
MADIVDTSPEFDAFARAAFLESPVVREQLWVERYEGAHPEVFAAYYDGHGTTEGRASVVRDLSTVRTRVRGAAPVEHRLIEEVEPAVGQALGLPDEPAPLHVLLVGSFSTDADVGRLDGRVTLFHCLEWFHSEEGMRLLVAHEDTHAWHEIALGSVPPEEDAAWLAFYEGLAIRATPRMSTSGTATVGSPSGCRGARSTVTTSWPASPPASMIPPRWRPGSAPAWSKDAGGWATTWPTSSCPSSTAPYRSWSP